MRITGNINSVPTRRKACVLGGDAASQSVKRYGTTIGQRLIAVLRYDSRNSRIAITNGAASFGPPSARHSHTQAAKARSVTGPRNRTSGHENHRAATIGADRGVHT